MKTRKRAAASGSKNASAAAVMPVETDPGVVRSKSTVSKVSHTLSVALARRLEEFAFFQRVSESAVIEYSLARFFEVSDDDGRLGEMLRNDGAGRRRKS
jgi:hypothetical protein